MLEEVRPPAKFPLRNLDRPVNTSSQHVIHANIQQTMVSDCCPPRVHHWLTIIPQEAGFELQGASKISPAVHVEVVMEKEKVIL